jgi:predicted DNA-binding transcriptional regulator AlpA
MPLIFSYDDVYARGVKLSKHRLWVLEQQGRFPRRVNVSPGRVGWVAEEIDRHIADLIAARDVAPAPVKRPRSPGRPRKPAVEAVS